MPTTREITTAALMDPSGLLLPEIMVEATLVDAFTHRAVDGWTPEGDRIAGSTSVLTDKTGALSLFLIPNDQISPPTTYRFTVHSGGFRIFYAQVATGNTPIDWYTLYQQQQAVNTPDTTLLSLLEKLAGHLTVIGGQPYWDGQPWAGGGGSGGIWYGTQAQYDALDPSLKVLHSLWTGTGYFEFHIFPDGTTTTALAANNISLALTLSTADLVGILVGDSITIGTTMSTAELVASNAVVADNGTVVMSMTGAELVGILAGNNIAIVTGMTTAELASGLAVSSDNLAIFPTLTTAELIGLLAANNMTISSTLGTAELTASDTTAPTVNTFTLGTVSGLSVPVTAFTASDNVGVTGYLITESSIAPLSTDAGWQSTATYWTSNGYTTGSAGTKTLYAWAKDAAGNVSASMSVSGVVFTSVSPGVVYVASLGAINTQGHYGIATQVDGSGYILDTSSTAFKGASVQNGDLMLLTAMGPAVALASNVIPAGWTMINSDTHGMVLYKFRGSGDTSVQFTTYDDGMSGTYNIEVSIYVFRNVNTTTPIDVKYPSTGFSTIPATTTSTLMGASLAPQSHSMLVFLAASTQNNKIVGSVSGIDSYRDFHDSNNVCILDMAYDSTSSGVGVAPSINLTTSVTSNTVQVLTLALKSAN